MRKVIRKRLRHDRDGVHVASDVNVVIATGGDEASSTQRIVQRSRSTASADSSDTTSEPADEDREQEKDTSTRGGEGR
jgi:hypothetical protein